jgi:hypothetical protein
MRALFILFALAMNTFAAGPLLFGARGGVPLTDRNNSFIGNTGESSLTSQYLVGPTVGLRLPLNFSVEGDALFHRQTLGFGQLIGVNSLSTHSDSWEFPVMLKFTAGHAAIAPVLGAGVSVRHINNFGDVPSYLFNGSTNANTVGFVAGAGLRFKAGPVDITPEVRFTRWNGNTFTQDLVNLVTGSQNQAQVLLGLTF